jgi:hypothetical protein
MVIDDPNLRRCVKLEYLEAYASDESVCVELRAYQFELDKKLRALG